jgi:hypothetical protein
VSPKLAVVLERKSSIASPSTSGTVVVAGDAVVGDAAAAAATTVAIMFASMELLFKMDGVDTDRRLFGLGYF